jgi:acetoin utilization protein AcuC
VAYVDVDAHHGDGVQSIFYGRGDVMTISLHESGRYLFPGTGHTYELGQGDGRGLSVNVPLEPFTEDASFDECFEAVVPRALEAFAPDLIVLQAGADMHRLDPLADLALSTRSFERTFRRMSELADAHAGGRIVATGGGGYDPFRTVPRVWALLWCALSGRDVPDELPESWRERWAGRASVPLPARLHDDTASWRPVPRRDAVASHNRVAVRRLFDSLEPIWREIGTRSTAARAAAKPHPQEES